MERHPVKSTDIKAIGYDATESILEIEFLSGNVYDYYGVPITVYESIMNAESKGRYFHKHVKDRFFCERLPQSDATPT